MHILIPATIAAAIAPPDVTTVITAAVTRFYPVHIPAHLAAMFFSVGNRVDSAVKQGSWVTTGFDG